MTLSELEINRLDRNWFVYAEGNTAEYRFEASSIGPVCRECQIWKPRCSAILLDEESVGK